MSLIAIVSLIITTLGFLLSLFALIWQWKEKRNYKKVINIAYDRMRGTWGHLDFIIRTASKMNQSIEKDEVVAHATNALNDSSNVNGILEFFK